MAYTKNLTQLNANAGYSGELCKALAPEISGDNQVLVNAACVDTSIVTGALVQIFPSGSGWGCDTNPDNAKFIPGILQEAPSSAGDRVNVCVGGFTYANLSSTITCTAWACEVDITSDQVCAHIGSTTPTTRHLGWIVSSGSITTAGNGIIFMDRPFIPVDSST